MMIVLNTYLCHLYRKLCFVMTYKKFNFFKKKQTTINFYKHNIILLFLFISVLSITCLFAIKKGFNKGIDFAGGYVVEVYCKNKCDIINLETDINNALKKKTIHQKIENGFLIKVPAGENDNYNAITQQIVNILNKQDYKHTLVLDRIDYASPQMSYNFIKDAIYACIFAFICIALYIIIRFNWKFSICAIISILYDVMLVINFIGILQIEVCLTTLTSILTIIGYCINDKIVIFDRVRHNLENNNILDCNTIILDSVKSTLTRSILTSFTTLIVCSSLLFFGDRTIYELGLTINIGIIIGTLSSILLAPSLLILLKINKRKPKIDKTPMFYAS